MGTTAAPAFAHTPLFTRPAGKKTRGRPADHRLTRAGVVVLAFLRAQSSTTIQQLATQINVPASTLRKVLRGDDGMSGARMERLLRWVSPSRRTEIFQKIPQHILHELIDGAGVLDVKTEVESKAVWRSTSGRPIPVHVQLDQLTVTANVVKMQEDIPSLWKWMEDWLPGGPRTSWVGLEAAEHAGQPHLVVRRGGPSKKEGLAYGDMPYRTVFDVVVFDRQRHGKEPILARIGIGRIALCRRHAWKLRNARDFSPPPCAACATKSRSKPQHCLRIEGGGFASGLAPTIAHTFFVPFTRPGSVWVTGYHLALDAELPLTNVVAVPRAVGRRGFRVVTAYADTGIEDDPRLITQPNEGMVTGLYFGGEPSPIVIYDKSERLALGHGARPRWLLERDAQMRARHGMHHDDVKFTRIELRLHLRDGNPEGLLARGAPGLLSRILVADRGALFADGLRAALLDELAFEGLLGYDEVTRVRFKGRPQPVAMKPFWRRLGLRRFCRETTAPVVERALAELVLRCDAGMLSPLASAWRTSSAHSVSFAGCMTTSWVDTYVVGRRASRRGRVNGYFALELFKRFAAERSDVTRIADLSKDVMREFNAWLALPRTSLHGKQARSVETVRKNTAIVQRMWQWLYDEDKRGTVPPPKLLKLGSSVPSSVIAPTCAEMDACIAACETEWHRQLTTLMRFTGLRVHQAMHIEWRDIDLKNATLRVRPELGKTKQEMRGRVVPISKHLVEILAGWGTREGFVVKSNRRGAWASDAFALYMDRAWTRANVRPEAWQGSPHHSFREGFQSELKRLRADDEAVKYLVGHSLGLRGRYVDPDALPMRQAVSLIPPLTPLDNIVPLKGIRSLNHVAT